MVSEWDSCITNNTNNSYPLKPSQPNSTIEIQPIKGDCKAMQSIPFNGNKLRIFFDNNVIKINTSLNDWKLTVNNVSYTPINVTREKGNYIDLHFAPSVPTHDGTILFTS